MDVNFHLEIGTALFYLIMGFSFLINANKLWIPFLEKLKDPVYLIFLGIFSLTIGTFMIISHNIWSLKPSVILTTVTAWGIFFEGIRYLFFPKHLFLPKSLGTLRWVGGFLSIITGLVILGGHHWMR